MVPEILCNLLEQQVDLHKNVEMENNSEIQKCENNSEGYISRMSQGFKRGIKWRIIGLTYLFL